MSGGVSLQDYDQYHGFGAEAFNSLHQRDPNLVTGQTLSLQDLRKALSAGDGGSGGSMANQTAGAGNLQPAITESLEATLKNLTLRREELKIWRVFKTSPAFALSEEFLQLTSIGDEDAGGFHDEFDLPEAQDSTYQRSAEQVKYLGTTRAISHQAQLVRTNLGSVINKEVDNGTLFILRILNRALIYGDSKVVPQEFNGIYAQHGSVGNDKNYSTIEEYHSSDLVVDMRGEPLTQSVFFDAAEAIDENHGNADTLYGSNSVISGLAKDYIEKQRIILNGSSQNLVAGAIPKTIPTPFGDIGLGIDKFLRPRKSRFTTDAATSTKAPTNIVPDATTPLAANSDPLSRFNSGGVDNSGDYFYGVASKNRFGMSQVVPLSNALLTIANGQSADLKFAMGSGTYAATGLVIYRSKANPATGISTTPLYPIFEISVGDLSSGYDGGSAGIVRDRDRFMPGTEQAFMWETGDEVSEFKQLAPLMRMDLARLDPSLRFMILMYGTPQLYNHLRIVRFKNIGAYTKP